jgi:hypothetical protein
MEAGHPTGYQYGRGGLRPLSVGETLDTAVELYTGNAVQLWTAVAVVVIPLQLIELIVRRATLPSGVFVHDGALYTTSLNGSTGGLLPVVLVGLIGVLANLLAVGAVFKMLLDGYLGRTPDWRESFLFARTKFLSLLWIAILASVVVIIGFVLLIIPGIYALVAVSVAVPVLMMEGVTGFSALGRSHALVRGRWWATLARELAGLLLIAVAAIVIGAITGALSSGLSVSNVTLFLFINAVLAAISAILTTPFVSAVTVVVYIDLRVRKDALDLELLAGAAGEPAGPAWSSPAERTYVETSWPRRQDAPPPPSGQGAARSATDPDPADWLRHQPPTTYPTTWPSEGEQSPRPGAGSGDRDSGAPGSPSGG